MIDTKYNYRNIYGKEKSAVTRLRIFLGEKKTVVVATELNENQGTSITNAVEYLAAEVCKDFGIEPSKLVWIEHYERDMELPERYDLVTMQFHDNQRGFRFVGPKWRPLQAEKVERAIVEKKIADIDVEQFLVKPKDNQNGFIND